MKMSDRFSSPSPSDGPKIIPFRRDASAATCVSAAGDEPPSSPAIPIGDAVQAVVLRLANKRIRLKVQARAAGRKDDGAGR